MTGRGVLLVGGLLLLAATPSHVHAQWKQLSEYVPPSARFPPSSDQSQPLKRAAHSLVAFHDSLYVFGGIGDTATEEDHEFDDTWRYDLLNDKWVQLIGDRSAGNGNSPLHRFHHATALHTNASVAEMVVFGGLSIAPKAKAQGAVVSTDMVVTQYNDVWRLTLAGPNGKETWRNDAAIASSLTGPTARSEAGAVAHDGQLYVFGGIAYDNTADASPKDFGDLWKYDLTACTWTLLQPPDGVSPPPRFSHSLTKLTTAAGETLLVVFSGRRLELPSWSLLGDTWVFSLKTSTWRMLDASMPLQRAYTSVVATGGASPTLWFFGGYFRPKQGANGYVYDDVVSGRLLPAESGDSPTSIQFYHAVFAPEDAVPPLRYNHRAVLWKDTMVIYGGSYQTQRGDLWAFNLTSAVLKQDAIQAMPVNMATLVYVLAGFVLAIVVVLLMLIVRWRRIDRRNLELARLRGVTVTARGLPKERLDQLEVVKYKKPTPLDPKTPPTPAADVVDKPNDDASASNEDICPICLIEFEEEEDVRNLPCKHLFHVACIDEWLGRNTTCPMCKNNLDLDVVNVEIVRQAPPSPAASAQPPSGGSIVAPALAGPSE